MQKVHWMLLLVLEVALCVGCSGTSGEPDTATVSNEQSTTNADHHAHGAGPHDGTLADWGGGKYHVEFTVSHDEKEATVYILGDDEKSPVPIATEEIQVSIVDPRMQVTLKAIPQEEDPQGTSSRFVGNDDGLGIVQEYAGTITGLVDGTPFSGDFKEEPHADH